MPVILALSVIIIVTLLYIHLTKHNDEWIEKKVTGPEPAFFFGNVEEAVLRRKHIGIVFKTIYDAYPKEKVLGIFLMRNPELLVRDLDVVESILKKDLDVFEDEANLSHKNNWGMQQIHFSSLLTTETLQNVMHLITERGDAFVEHVDQIAQLKQDQDVQDLVKKFTQASVAACAFGVNPDTFNNEYDTRLTDRKIFNFGRELEMMYPGILKKLKHYGESKKINALIFNLVKNLMVDSNIEPNDKTFIDMISKLCKQEQILAQKNNGDTHEHDTHDVIAAQAYRFYVLGYETTASTLAFLLYQLALNPDIQDKLVTEIKEMLEKHNGEITLQSVLDLSYMGKVIDETLRMYPVIPDLKRKSTKAFKIPGTNLRIEKDQVIKISVLGIHYDENIYSKPEVFDPERFTPENIKARHSCSYMPFGLGQTQCIGMHFAQALSRVCLVKLLSQFRVEPSQNTPRLVEYDPMSNVLSPKGGLLINFVRRGAS